MRVTNTTKSSHSALILIDSANHTSQQINDIKRYFVNMGKDLVNIVKSVQQFFPAYMLLQSKANYTLYI